MRSKNLKAHEAFVSTDVPLSEMPFT